MVKRPRGRPQIPKSQRTDRSGFTQSQRRQLRSEAHRRGVSMAVIVREMADFYFTALERSRDESVESSTIPAETVPADTS